MYLPIIQGTIVRRLLINFTVDPQIVTGLLPSHFRPLCHGGKAIIGVCLIRFSALRPVGVPSFLGLSSENAAHRIAVEWDSPQGVRQGVYIFRRDTSSLLNTLVGGRLFPGVQHKANFTTFDEPPKHKVKYTSQDGTTEVRVEGHRTPSLPSQSVFKDLATSSHFFKLGATGFSPDFRQDQQQGMRLVVDDWKVQAFEVNNVFSSFFSNENIFPKNSVVYDHSLLMLNVPHQWIPVNKDESPT